MMPWGSDDVTVMRDDYLRGERQKNRPVSVYLPAGVTARIDALRDRGVNLVVSRICRDAVIRVLDEIEMEEGKS